MKQLWNIQRQNTESVQRNDIDDFLLSVENYDFQEAEMIEAFVDFQNDLLLYGIGFELRNEVTR
nr:MAG TPA: hypothetical protein [Caudoviricetes sp.]